MLKTQSMVTRRSRRDAFEEEYEKAIELTLKELGIDENWPNEPPADPSDDPSAPAYIPPRFTPPRE